MPTNSSASSPTAQAVLLKAERERYADAINIDIYLRKNFKKDWKWAFKELTTPSSLSGFLTSRSSEGGLTASQL